MNKISFAILCNYIQSVATTFCLLLFPSISSYNQQIILILMYQTSESYFEDNLPRLVAIGQQREG